MSDSTQHDVKDPEDTGRLMHARPIVDRNGRRPLNTNKVLAALGSMLYAVETNDGLVKIGITSNMRYRRYTIATGGAQILAFRLGATLDDEREVHRRLSGLAVRGREWYPRVPEVMAVVNEMRAELDLEPLAA